jgi:ABC-type lipoprotein release transport system permease subunit
LRAIILATLAGLALLLAAIGLYAVLSPLIVQRTQEFGVRRTLGAQRSDLLKLVIREGMVLTFSGFTAGLIIAASLTGLLSSILYGVKPTDPVTIAVVSLLLVLISLLATYMRATRVQSRSDRGFEIRMRVCWGALCVARVATYLVHPTGIRIIRDSSDGGPRLSR